jgi:hypothetical protein
MPERRLAASRQTGSASASFSTQSSAALNLAGFLVILTTPHFFLNAASFHQFAEAADRLLNRLSITYDKTNHSSS